MYKKILFRGLIYTGFLLISIVIIGIVIDPLQQYRKSTWYNPYYGSEELLLPGIIKNYDYDSIIIGTSMTENFKIHWFDNKFNCKSIKLCLSASTAHDQNTIFISAINTGKVKKVFYGLDVYSFQGDEKRAKHPLPDYLMNDNLWDDYKYLLNFDIFYRENTKIFLTNVFSYHKEKMNYDTMFEWNHDWIFGEKIALQDYINNRNGLKYGNEYRFATLKKNFDTNILPILKNENIVFYIFYPPYSILAYKRMEESGWLKDVIQFKKYIYETTKIYPNIKIYDFQTDRSITHNLNNYKDINHYSQKINYQIVNSIYHNKYLVTEQSIEPYLTELATQATNYQCTK